MACHTANMAFRALKLGYPTSVVAEATDVNLDLPSSAKVTLEFPGAGGHAPGHLQLVRRQTRRQETAAPGELIEKR